MKRNENILLIGTGYMGYEYYKVLRSLKKSIIAVGRSEASANAFEHKAHIPVSAGGIEKWLKVNTCPGKSIVAVSQQDLGSVTLALIKHGAKSILVEKPGGTDYRQIRYVTNKAKTAKAKIYIAYNRRFYASVRKTKELIIRDGGIISCHFEFTEWEHVITKVYKSDTIKRNLFLHNSTHVVDLAFYLCGIPEKITAYTSGSLSWHPTAAVFTGAGVTISKIPFSYHANWQSAGRWGVELMTKKRKLILRPLEKVFEQNKHLEIKEVTIDDKIEREFKPGLYQEVVSFLGNKKYLCTIDEQLRNIKYYKLICPY